MDSSPAFSADLLAALFSMNGRAGLAGALADSASQRGPPGELSGQPTGLHPGMTAFAELLSGLALPPAGGSGLPVAGNALPPTMPATPGLRVVPHPQGIAAALSSAPSPARLGQANLAGALLVPIPSDEGASVIPATDAPRLALPLRTETPPSAPLLGTPDEPLAPVIETPLRPPLPATESRPARPSPGLAKGVLAADPGSLTTSSSTPVPPADWRLTERPIKLTPQQASPETPTRELPPDVSVAVRQTTISGALPDPSGSAASGWVTGTPLTMGAQPTDSLAPAPTPFTGTPLSSVDPAALAGRVHWMIDNAVGEARIKLNPPELGALDIKISMVDDKAYVQLAATQMGASELLEAALPRLRELLNIGGVELAGATVSHEGAERSAPEPSAEPQRDSVDVQNEETVESTPARRASGQIDLYA